VTDDHLSLDELAELDEGILPLERVSAAQAHLADCAQCRAGADAITAARSALADLPSVPMPADVQARLNQAIAAEAGETGESGARTVVPDVVALPRRRFGFPTMAASAAAAAVILAVGAVVVAHIQQGGGPSTTAGSTADAPLSSATGAGSAGAPNSHLPTSVTGTTYTPASLPGQIATLLGANTVGLPLAAPTASPAKPRGGASRKAVPSTKTLASGSPTYSTALSAGISKSLLPLRSSPSKLLTCAESLAPTLGTLPIAVDFGRWAGPRYHGAPSVIFVFADATPKTFLVYVVGPTCGSDAIRTFTQVTLP
jgi:hypothetical protein